MPPKKKAVPWQKSKAKALLRSGILNGTISANMTAEEIYAMDDEHKKWNFTNWTKNLGTLRAAISRDRGRMARDARDYGHDRTIVMKLRQNDPKKPWHKTECPKLLKKDVNEEKHLSMKPNQLYLSRPEYQEFELSVFRNHIYQGVDSRPKRAARFEKKKASWKYPELHQNHPRLQQTNNTE